MRLAECDTTVGIFDDRVGMTAEGAADIYLDVPDVTPLTADETHATLRVAGEDYRARVELDAAAVDALADALHHVQEGDQ